MYSNLFQPLRVGRTQMRNRIVHAPMSVCYGDTEGRVTPAMIEHYARRAQGGAAMIIVENVAVSPRGRQLPRQPMLYDAQDVPGFGRLASAIHHHGALAIAQVVHAGRYAAPWENYASQLHLAPSAVAFELLGQSVVPTAMTQDDIVQACDDFARTARLLIDAGFDGVQLHGATGFLIAQFLSPRTNTRADAYGGSLENRCRFGLEVYAAVRRAIGPQPIVGMQLFADELHAEGASLADAKRFARELEIAGCDFVMPVVGTFETLRSPAQAGLNRRPAYQLDEIAAIKRVVAMPVFANGGLGDPALAEQILRRGEADAIGLARPLFADPDWPAKVKAGRDADIRHCACTHNTCYRTQSTGGVCESWPEPAQRP